MPYTASFPSPGRNRRRRHHRGGYWQAHANGYSSCRARRHRRLLVGYVDGQTSSGDVPHDAHEDEPLPNMPAWKALLPIAVPILLIALGAFTKMQHGSGFLQVLGDPVIALSVGVLLALWTGTGWKKAEVSRLMLEASEKAGGILVIIGAGGAFGAILATTDLGTHLSDALPLAQLGLFFPFLLAVLLKTAQGSSTVAIITAAAIVGQLLPRLGLDSEQGRLLCMLALGAGSMSISHANDAYFWVISKFSGLEMQPMLKVYSVATLLMGITAFLAVLALSAMTM